MDEVFTDVILENENKLLSSQYRQSADFLNELLADDFVEFGSSGNVYYKQDILRQLPGESNLHMAMIHPDLKMLDKHIVLLTYTAKKNQFNDKCFIVIIAMFNMEEN